MKRPEPFVWRKNTGVENYGSLVECEKCGFIDESTESASRDEKTLTVRCTVYFKCPNCAAEKTVAVRSVRLRKRPNLKKRMCGGEEEETEVPEVL
ncbi:hypothetical protein OWV82_006969 [Melia azedarach]|uniref:Uncharacterized protein n=1 Tax=Melia azedarach TaxID=155640 RepID=A0ACC1YKQ7_MELAZ|nr:hypothetical protein OWV82_006969 [Melia azedarach]